MISKKHIVWVSSTCKKLTALPLLLTFLDNHRADDLVTPGGLVAINFVPPWPLVSRPSCSPWCFRLSHWDVL
ncbi:unnamed protein product [Amoebophrya sp. A25]|nr:unnamed protein product [Amoebophrya sp. A25]|eukprot:GSA25T00003891001.1